MISTLLNTLLELAPYVVLGFIMAGILKFYVPQNILQKHLGGRLLRHLSSRLELAVFCLCVRLVQYRLESDCSEATCRKPLNGLFSTWAPI